MAKSRWHGALRSAHKSCTHGHVFRKRGGVKRGLVADPWTSSRRFSHVLWLKVHSHLLLRACLLGSKRKLPPQACQVRPGLPSVACHPRGVQFPCTVYIHSQGPFSSALAHCISCAPSACSHCRRCCCCPLQWDRQRMETRLNSAGGPVPYSRSWSLSFLHLLSVLSSPLLLSKSRASWHIPQAIQRWLQGHRHRDPPRGPQSGTLLLRLQAQWWRAVGWVLILGEHQPSLQTLHCTPHQHGHGSVHLHTSPAPVAQSTPPHKVFSAPTRWPSEALDRTPSPGLRKQIFDLQVILMLPTEYQVNWPRCAGVSF